MIAYSRTLFYYDMIKQVFLPPIEDAKKMDIFQRKIHGKEVIIKDDKYYVSLDDKLYEVNKKYCINIPEDSYFEKENIKALFANHTNKCELDEPQEEINEMYERKGKIK